MFRLLIVAALSLSVSGQTVVSTYSTGRTIASVKSYGAVGNGTTDDTAAFASALTDHDTVEVPPGTYLISNTLDLTSGTTIFCQSQPDRWRAGSSACVLKYAGDTAAIQIGGDTTVASVTLRGITLVGTSSSGTVDGVRLVGTSASVEGILLENVTVVNFPRYQIYAEGVVYDVTFRRFSGLNSARAADNIIHFYYPGSGGAPSQITCDDCWLMPYTENKWAFWSNLATDVRFIGGTVAPYNVGSSGAHGIYVNGGLYVFGTHLEGPLGTQNGSVGIRYTGTNGAVILPGAVSMFCTGLQIGNPTSKTTSALSSVIGGSIGNNNYNAGTRPSCSDVELVDGGSRQYTSISTVGLPSGTFVLRNLRGTTDGVYSDIVSNLMEGFSLSSGKTFSSLGTAISGYSTWCSDCNVASPCTSGGSGAWAFVSGGSWKCPF